MNAPVSTPLAHPVGELFAEDGDFVFRTLRYLGVSPSALDDALQDVFVTAYRKWSSFEGRSSARTWLYGIARRVAFRYRRKQKTQSERFLLDLVDGEEHPFDRLQAGRCVSQLVAALDETKRAAFILVEVEGLTAPEASELLDVPTGTVYSRVRAAWKALRAEADSEQAVIAAIADKPTLDDDRRASIQRGIAAGCLGKAAVPVALTVVWGSVGLGVGGLALGGLLWMSQDAPPRPLDVPVAASAAQPSAPHGGAPATVSSPNEPRTSEEPSASADVAAGASDRGPQSDVDPSAGRRRPASPSVRPRATPADDQPPPRSGAGQAPSSDASPAAEVSTLAAEMEIMRVAQAAIRKGDHDAARDALARHAQKFPDGQLLEDRKAALVKLAELVESSEN